MARRFPAPWQVEQTPGGYKVLDANGQALAYVYARETKQQADIANIAKVLTFDEARRIVVNVAKLSRLLGRRIPLDDRSTGDPRSRNARERLRAN